jgi:hypothetical protein
MFAGPSPLAAGTSFQSRAVPLVMAQRQLDSHSDESGGKLLFLSNL